MSHVKPSVAWLTTNRSCNFRCRWCYARGESFRPEMTMSLGLAERILAIICNLGIKKLLIIGGEPTLWEPLIAFNGICREKGVKTTLVTNAARFSSDRFWDAYLSSPNHKVGPSIKAHDSDSAGRLAGINNWEVVKSGLTRLVHKYQCGVSFVHSSYTRNRLLDMATFAKDCGANRIGISPCTPGFENGRPSTDGMLPLSLIIEDIVKNYDRLHDLMAGKLTFSPKTPLCLWPREFIETTEKRGQLNTGCQFQNRSGIVFGPMGELYACNSMSEFALGQIDTDYVDGDSLIRLLEREEVSKAYETVNSFPSERCVGCPKAKFCGGGCPLNWTVYDPKSSITGW